MLIGHVQGTGVQNGHTGTSGSGVVSTGGVGPGTGNDWGAVFLNGVHRYARLVVAVGAIIVLARYPMTRPLAAAIVIIALLSRVGVLGKAMQTFVNGVFATN